MAARKALWLGRCSPVKEARQGAALFGGGGAVFCRGRRCGCIGCCCCGLCSDRRLRLPNSPHLGPVRSGYDFHSLVGGGRNRGRALLDAPDLFPVRPNVHLSRERSTLSDRNLISRDGSAPAQPRFGGAAGVQKARERLLVTGGRSSIARHGARRRGRFADPAHLGAVLPYIHVAPAVAGHGHAATLLFGGVSAGQEICETGVGGRRAGPCRCLSPDPPHLFAICAGVHLAVVGR
mmetsp:Transcript_17978/g.51042  ORF Transcript_17978/g.51042 Transcript_17978/m.51042 type:complete len:235 (-) Transcript_17978:848-1552(-)